MGGWVCSIVSQESLENGGMSTEEMCVGKLECDILGCWADNGGPCGFLGLRVRVRVGARNNNRGNELHGSDPRIHCFRTHIITLRLTII